MQNGTTTKAQQLRHRLAGPEVIRVAGAHDALSALVAEHAGFDAMWASSLAISAARGLPDMSLLTMTDYLQAAAYINEVRVAEVADPHWSDADFVIVHGGSSGGALARVRQGTPHDPAAGATAIYEVAAVGDGPVALTLRGPGVGPEPRVLRVGGLAEDEIALFQQTRAGYPCGVDILLVDLDGRCAALPRSTALERAA
jgi:phosphonate C-P lyase system protein PhnH